jgi:hypothetical protein
LCLPDAFNDVLVQSLMPDGPVVALNIRVLLWLSRLDVAKTDAKLCSSGSQRFADIFWTVINTNTHRLAKPFNDPPLVADYVLDRQRKINLDPQAFTIEVVQRIEKSKHPALLRPDIRFMIRYDLPMMNAS